jgi:hypothetical protein
MFSPAAKKKQKPNTQVADVGGPFRSGESNYVLFENSGTCSSVVGMEHIFNFF